MKRTAAAALICSFTLLSACGFKPIYATPANGGAPLNQLVKVGAVSAPDTVQVLIADALNNRIVLQEGQSPKYQLSVEATESAQQLAVQIDATVTRYNYRLNSRYTLLDLTTGKSISGRARAVSSYNIVSSQYSTLFAERTAQEKAARLLAEDIERDLLIRFAEGLDAQTMDTEADIGAEFEGDYDNIVTESDDSLELIETWQRGDDRP